MNSELEAYFASARRGAATPADPAAQQKEQTAFTARFLEHAESIVKPVLDSTAETLHRNGYGATVELVRDQAGSDPNTFPYAVLHFSPRPSPAADLGYIYTLAGASVSFICRRNELCVEAVIAHPAGRGVERRVNFSTLGLAELTPERVMRIVTDAVKQIVRV
jgi:hypothetical protein